MTIELTGDWDKGLAFDVHTLSSTYLGVDGAGYAHWDTQRTEMGELLYRLKYHQDTNTIPRIIELLDKIKGIEKFDYIVPIPSTNKVRKIQPVIVIAKALGDKYGVDVLYDLIIKSGRNKELKNEYDPDERIRLLRETMNISDKDSVKGKQILLLDDLYRSGSTLRVATELIYGAGAERVCVLTMTKTRSNR